MSPRAPGACAALLALSACTAPPLDHATDVSLTLATPADQARERQAGDNWFRHIIVGVSVRDDQGHVAIAKKDQDGIFKLDGKPVPVSVPVFRSQAKSLLWPVLRIAFSLDAPPIPTSDANEPASTIVYPCNADDPRDPYIGGGPIMWHGAYVTGETVKAIEAATTPTTKSQPYEVVARYFYGDRGVTPDQPTTLKLPEGDLCLSATTLYYPVKLAVGRPLRLPHDAVVAVLAPYPHIIPWSAGPTP